MMNPYIHEGARVRVVDDKAAPCLLVIGEEKTVQAVSNSGKYIDVGGWGYLHVSRFKPVVRVKAGRCVFAGHSWCAYSPCTVCKWPNS